MRTPKYRSIPHARKDGSGHQRSTTLDSHTPWSKYPFCQWQVGSVLPRFRPRSAPQRGLSSSTHHHQRDGPAASLGRESMGTEQCAMVVSVLIFLFQFFFWGGAAISPRDARHGQDTNGYSQVGRWGMGTSMGCVLWTSKLSVITCASNEMWPEWNRNTTYLPIRGAGLWPIAWHVA